MDAEEVMKLFDFKWFGGEEIIIKQSVTSPLQNPDLEIPKDLIKPELIRVSSSRHVRSFSDQLSSQTSLDSDILSPKSVLTSQYKLQTIVSGKEGYVTELDVPKIEDIIIIEKPKQGKSKQRRRRNSSKSLSDLEFEELKGFMDLGFVFSEEDKNSSLVSIIPGLQRLGKEDEKHEEQDNEEHEDNEEEDDDIFFEENTKHHQMVSRPYLSEAWEVMNQRRRLEQNQLMNWRFPAMSNEIDMKHHLRSWAHSVASTVR